MTMLSPAAHTLVSLGLGLAGVVHPAAVAKPTTTIEWGWWSQGSVAGLNLESPPQAPDNGLAIEGSAAGPFTVSAVQVTAPAMKQIRLTLPISGQDVMTGAPEGCALVSSFQPVEGGAWSDRPSWNCSDFVQGVVSKSKQTVSFTFRVPRTGKYGLAILPTGTLDVVGFDRPRTSLLGRVVHPATPGKPTAAPDSSAPTDPAGVAKRPEGRTTRVEAGAPETSLPQGSTTVTRDSGGPSASSPVVADPGTPATTQAATPQSAEPTALTASSGSTGSTRRKLGIDIGLALILLLITYWADGFGALPIRTLRRERTSMSKNRLDR